MRRQLKARDGDRLTFRGVFVRYGKKPAWRGPEPKTTLLFRKIIEVESGQIVAEHLWFNETKRFKAMGNLVEGDVIQFDARVTPYRKGYWGRDWERQIENPPGWNYKLSYPTKISRAGKEMISDEAF